MKFNKKLKKGFTLVELIVVIAIVAILAAVSVVSYIAFINSANESADVQLVKQLNTCLQADEALHGKKDWSEDYPGLTSLLESNGFIIENLTKTKSGCDMVYQGRIDENTIINRYALLRGNDVIYSETTFATASNCRNLWIPETAKEAQDLSEAGKGVVLGSEIGEIPLFEAHGSVIVNGAKVSSIRYKNSTENAQNVVIRTNGGNLTVDAPNDTVAWFGSAKIDIEAVDKTHSFHAYGRPIGEIKIKSGHYFVESTYESNFLVLGDEVTIDTQTNEDVIVLKDSSVSSYTVNGVVYSNSSVVSGETQKAAIDETKALLNANTKVAYNTFQEAIDAANYGDKLVLLKDLVIEDNSPTPTKENNNAAITIRDKAFSLNGNGNTITSDGKHSGSYTSHDLFNLECSGSIAKTITMNIYSLNIEATHYQDVFLINSDVDYDFILNLSDSSVTCDGECIYSNGPRAIAVLNNCEFIHEGVYAEGKDDRYYSALIVGYGGFINAYNCKVKSFGNGVTTFPSGGVVNLFDTDINIDEVTGSASSGYAIRCTMEPNSYEGLYVIRGAEVSVYGGIVHGDFSLKDTSVSYDAKISLYEGIFDHDPSAYVVDGKTCTHSGDNWIVK